MSQHTVSTTTERKYRCDNCIPLWNRTGNVKGVQLCDVHASTKDLLTALKALCAKCPVTTETLAELKSSQVAIRRAEEGG